MDATARKPPPSTEYQLARELAAVKQLREDIAAAAGGDEELMLDAIEGETGLHEAVASVLMSIDDDAILLAGIKARKEELTERERRIKAGVDRKRALIERAMTIAETPKLTLPIATLSLARRAPALVVVDEAAIPSDFWHQPPAPPPELDKTVVTDWLRARAEALAEAAEIDDAERRAAAVAEADRAFPAIPGAQLDNGSVSLTVRRK